MFLIATSSVKRAASKMDGRPINVLVNNASVAAPKDDLGRKTIDGFEVRSVWAGTMPEACFSSCDLICIYQVHHMINR